MGRYFLGIDAGNTVVKTVLFDAAGSEIAHACREAVSHCPHPGFVERDIDQLRHDLMAVVTEVVRKAGVETSDIAAIGSAGHGNGLYLWVQVARRFWEFSRLIRGPTYSSIP